jgi:hypothetical protein
MKYIRQKDGTFSKEGSVKQRYVNLRIYRKGMWKEPITPIQRTVICDLLDNEDSKYLPGDIYELIGIESSMTEEDKEKLKQLSKRKVDMETNIQIEEKKRATFVDDKGVERYSDNKRKVRVAKPRTDSEKSE